MAAQEALDSLCSMSMGSADCREAAECLDGVSGAGQIGSNGSAGAEDGGNRGADDSGRGVSTVGSSSAIVQIENFLVFVLVTIVLWDSSCHRLAGSLQV